MSDNGTISDSNIYVVADADKIIFGSKYVLNPYTKSEIDNKLKNKADASAMGDINNLTVVGITDLVSAVNKLDMERTQNINLNGNNLTVTYKNGTTITCDLSSLISNIKTSDLSNIDDSTVTDKQVLAYDSVSNKYIPYTIDNTSVLQDAKDYTDSKVNTIASASRLVSDIKPTYSVVDDVPTITYEQDSETKTTTDTNIWFYYKVDSVPCQTIFISGVEFTIEGIGDIDFTEYVNKTTDVVSTYTGNEYDTSKIPDIGALKALQSIINNLISTKVNTTDVVNDLLHTDENKPLSANQGRELRRMVEDVSANISGGASVVIKKYFYNVVANTEYSFDSKLPLNDCAIINCHNVASGTVNQTDTLKEFTNNTKQDFIKTDDFTIDNNGAKIKDKYTINETFNENMYEYDIFDKFDSVNMITEEGV